MDKQTNKPLRDLMESIQFAESVATKIHGVLDKAKIFRTVTEEFAKSKKYTASILLLTDDESELKIVETSLTPKQIETGERVVGLRPKGHKIDLSKSSIYRQVIREGKTVQANVGDIVDELFPQPLARLIAKTFGYEKKTCILTPLKRSGRTIGALAVTSTDLAEHFMPSVKSLARHISTALELTDEHAECKKAEEAVRERTERLSQLVESQKEFIAHVGHELRTPLSVIKAVVESEMEVNGESPLAPQLALVNRKVDQTTLTLKNLLRVSRLDMGQEGVQRTKFKLKDLIQEVLQDVLKEVGGKGLAWDVKINCPEEIELHADRIKLFEVLANLLRNSIIHADPLRPRSEARGKPQIVLKAERQEDKVRLAVEDSNLPIPKDELEKIFGRFYRGRYARRRTGSGLGLYISKRLVELLGGQIWVESKKGAGNRFVVEIPTDALQDI